MSERNEVQRTCEHYLNLYHNIRWWYVRLNAGGVPTEGGHYVKLAPAGTADGVVFMKYVVDEVYWGQRTVFLEYKSPKGKLTESQVSFKEFVESMGYEYYVIRSLDDLMDIEGVK